MAVTIVKQSASVLITQVVLDDALAVSNAEATVLITPMSGPVVSVSATAPATVDITQVPAPNPATIEISASGPADAIVVMNPSKGPKGDPGADGAAGGGADVFERVNTDISGVWLATFYVQDANTAGDWEITKIDGDGNASVSYSDDTDNSGLSVAQGWATRATLSYT